MPKLRPSPAPAVAAPPAPAARPALTVSLPPAECVEIRGARQNNLKGIDLDLPLGKLNVITGPSGSGKSSLAFDTIYAEGQRRYVETFSPYTRQFLDRMDKPQVDSIRGIPPAIAIEQSNQVKSTRSTVGTITEINDYLKLLMPRVARAFCPSCAGEIRPDSPREIVEQILAARPGATLLLTFAVPVPENTDPAEFFRFLQSQGYLRVWLGERGVVRTDEALDVALKSLSGKVRVIQDRVVMSPETRSRLTESVEIALRFGKGRVCFLDPLHPEVDGIPFSTGWHCARCDLDIKPPSAGLFSFNNPVGACPSCRGFGRVIGLDLDRALPDKRKAIAKGLVKPFQSGQSAECQKDLLRACAKERIDVNAPFESLSERDQKFVLYGQSRRPDAGKKVSDELWEEGGWYGVKGYFDWLETKTYKMHVRVLLSRYRAYTLCPECHGGRYQPATLNYRLVPPVGTPLRGVPETDPAADATRKEREQSRGRLGEASLPGGLTLPQLAELPIKVLADLLAGVVVPANDPSAEMLQKEIVARLRYLIAVGLGYLNLDRPTRTLSGGEIERVNLTTCLGASLVNTLFVLDEPSVGLHPRDVGRLIRVMQDLRDKGNTLLVVEHEESVIRAADHLIDIGPGRGEAGGELVFAGALRDLLASTAEPHAKAAKVAKAEGDGKEAGSNPRESIPLPLPSPKKPFRPSRPLREAPSAPRSLTAEYLSGRKTVPWPAPEERRRPARWLGIRGAREHNLQNLDVDVPLGVFTCVTGVSGSGKSTLIHGVLYENLLRAKGQGSDEPAGLCDELLGGDHVGQVVMVDQKPLAKTPRSSPVLYLGVYDAVREIFAASDDARAAGLSASSFSFNSGDGRCERCGGIGFEKIEMQFLSDLFVRCAECEGRRFQPHVLRVRYGDRNVHEVLEMTVSDAHAFFKFQSDPEFTKEAKLQRLLQPLQLLTEVGLGYLRLGQPLNTLSGGEAQRLKLVGHLVERARNPEIRNALLIFDEPTTGLHFDDVALLVKVFQRLVDEGESLLVIEHNLEVIKCADWIIDLGPEAGTDGGLLVAAGTPEAVAANEASHTGRYLKAILDPGYRMLDGRNGDSGANHHSLVLAAETPPVYGQPASIQHRPTPAIRVRGAREHNLKNLSLDLPREKMVIVTGLSGSGKSTLAFDILFAEGQRRFLDSMSAYARQFVEQLEKPDVDSIEGLPPSVAIEQRITRGGGKSTVATVTEVYHFLRLLFSKLGTQFCPRCQVPVEKQSQGAIVAQVEAAAKRGRVRVLAPLIKARKGFHTEVAGWVLKQGLTTMLVDGQFVEAEGFKRLERFREHTIDVVVGEFDAKRLAGVREAVARAIKVGKGTAKLMDAKNRATVLSTEMSCPECGQAFEELDPRLFSYNSPHGWCEGCRGFGHLWNTAGLMPKMDDNASQTERELAEERASAWAEPDETKPCPKCDGARLNAVARNVRLTQTAGRHKPGKNGTGTPLTIDHFARLPVREATRALETLRFEGNQKTIATDILVEIEQRLKFMAEVGLDYLTLDRSAKTLSGGETQRIRLAAQLGSNLRGVLYVLDEPTIGLHPRDNARLLDTLEALKDKGNSLVIVEHDDETMRRADFIVDLGPGPGVHGGEVVASGTRAEIEAHPHSVTGRCLREPMRHPMRGSRRKLPKVNGNGATDPAVESADAWIELVGASANNLRDISVRFPVGRLSVITGISGSGKSSLMRAVLLPAAHAAIEKAKGKKNSKSQISNLKSRKRPQPWREFRGVERLEAVYEVDQSPIGKTSRSTPATYVGVLDEIRALFAQVPLARMRGFGPGRFSFNNEGGRCETCGGMGVIRHEMAFLPTSYVPCEDCRGLRYNPQTLEVLYNDKSIGEVLQLTIEQAADFFRSNPKLHRPLGLLTETGLGYLRLGQPSPTLSGGEAQRMKLVTELTRGVGAAETAKLRRRRTPKSTLYLLEEPTVGLHMADVEQLLKVLHRLVEEGNTVVVIEHHLSVIAEADYVADIGPEAGEHGGKLVTSGTPEQVARHKHSRIAPFLREVLSK